MHDPMTVVKDIRNPFTGNTLVTVWHVDPEKDGSDDSCDWFGGRKLTDQQKDIRDKIASAFAFEWHRSAPYERFGWFMPEGVAVGPTGEKRWWDGDQNYTTHALVLAMFRIAANHHFGHWSRRASRFLNRHLFDILFFAENSCDSLCTDIEQKHGARDGNREKQAKRFASVVYAWILRAERPWYRHPRWHWWHWRLQIHPLQALRRRFLTRCEKCGKHFTSGQSAVGSWSDPPRRWFESLRSERGLRHMECDHSTVTAGC